METNRIYLNGREEKIGEALSETEHFAGDNGLSEKETRRLRLLTEELIGMMRGIAGDYTALFWLEGEGRECHLRLQAKTEMDFDKREELIAASTSGKNEAAVGIVGKLRNLIEIGLQSYDEVEKYRVDMGMPGAFYDYGIDPEAAVLGANVWSLSTYRSNIDEQREAGNDVEEDWDELEKSVLANLADDVHVGIRKDEVDITVDKTF